MLSQTIEATPMMSTTCRRSIPAAICSPVIVVSVTKCSTCGLHVDKASMGVSSIRQADDGRSADICQLRGSLPDGIVRTKLHPTKLCCAGMRSSQQTTRRTTRRKPLQRLLCTAHPATRIVPTDAKDVLVYGCSGNR